MKTLALDLGCGKKPKNPFNCDSVYGIDVDERLASPLIKLADLAINPIPFDDNYFDVITAYDFIEHIPRVIYLPTRRNPFIELMNEISRTLKPGGIFFSTTPAYPHPAAFQDPTHVNIITEKTFINYFSCAHKNYASMYGFIGELNHLGQFWKNESHLNVTMQKTFYENGLRSLLGVDVASNKFQSVTGVLKISI